MDTGKQLIDLKVSLGYLSKTAVKQLCANL